MAERVIAQRVFGTPASDMTLRVNGVAVPRDGGIAGACPEHDAGRTSIGSTRATRRRGLGGTTLISGARS